MQSAADGPPENTAPAVAAKVALIKLEKHAYEAWKSKDAKFWRTFLSDNFIGWGSPGRHQTSATKEYTGTDCRIESYALSDEQVSLLADTWEWTFGINLLARREGT